LRSVIALATVAVVLFATAFWFGPRSCDGGLETYFVCGAGVWVGGLAAADFRIMCRLF